MISKIWKKQTMNLLQVLAALLTLALLFGPLATAQAQAQGSNSITTLVSGNINSITAPDTGGYVGEYTSLVLDGSGNPVVSYYDATNRELKIMHCNDPNCAGGDESITAPDPGVGVGEYSSLALDSNGNPVVSYYDAINGGLKIMHCNDPNCAGRDESITAPDTGGYVGQYTSLALDSNGYPVVSYYDFYNQSLKIMHCNDPDCAGGNESITYGESGSSTNYVGEYSSLALDSSGHPVVSYYDAYRDNQDLRVLHCNDADCSGSRSSTAPDSVGDVGQYTSLALDANGYPVVSYYDGTNGDLKIMHCNDANCLGGNESLTSPDTVGDVGYYTSLALDSSGYPVVSYFDTTHGDLKVLRCNDADCSGGGESLTSPDTAGNVGWYTSLALDSLGHPVVSYYDQTNGNLKILHCGTSDCIPQCPTFPYTVPASASKTLQFVIACANANATNDVINLTDSTYTLTAVNNSDDGQGDNGLPSILDAATAGALTINGNGATITRDGAAPSFRMFYLYPGANLTLDNLTLSNGSSLTRDGGAIFENSSTLTITNSTLSGNTGPFGGAIFQGLGTLTVTNSTFSGNTATGSFAGGIAKSGGTTTITSSTFSGNSAGSDGSAIANDNGALTLINSTVTGSTVAGDSVYNFQTGITTITNSTIANNNGGVRNGGGTLNLNNSIVAYNTSGNGNCSRSSGTINAQNSLIGDSLTCINGTNTANLTGDPSLGTLTGSPAYYPLNAGSIAINAGDNALAVDASGNPLTTDEAGNARIQGGTVDMGAYESPYTPAAPTITTQPQDTTIFSGQTATLTVVASGSSPSYQWYQGTSGDTSTPVGSDSDSFTTPALTADTSYWVRVSNPGGSVDSNTATVTVEPAPTITTQPQSQIIGSGQTATLTVVASGTSLSYQWYQGNSGDTSTPVGSDSDTFTTPALTADTSYWVRVSNPAGSVDSNTATITIGRPPTITSANSATFVEGVAGSFTITTAAGVPAATTISESGVLPGGISFIDNGDGTATLSGTPAIGTHGTHNLTITASNGIAPDATQDFTLNILPPTVQVTVETNPNGLSFTVDGTTYSSSQTFTWVPLSSHTLETTSPQAGTPGTQYGFDNWSDSGAIAHSVTVPGADTTYTASFKTQYQLTTAVNPSNGGSVSPASGTYYDANTDVSLTATANSGFAFLNWTGNVADATAASTTITMSGPQSVTANFKASTSLLYNGDQLVNIGNNVELAAQLSSPASACLSGQTISFSLDFNPLDVSAGPYFLGSATTGSNGQATLSVSTSGWQEGIYDITASFAGTTDCDPASDDATLTAASPGDSATGGGWYTLSGSGHINFGFNVRKVDSNCQSNCAYKGQVLLINNGKWRLKGTLDSYVETSTGQGAASGSGDLYWWDQSLNGGLGDWVLAQSGVSFTINFYDSGQKGKKSSDTFGINIQYVPVPPQPNALPNSAPQLLKGGDIKVN